MKISVVVLAFDRRESVRELLDHLHPLHARLCELIVVDNASRDGTSEMIERDFPWVRLIRNEVNLGASGRGRGMLAARGDIVITLDDDVFGLRPEHLDHIVERFDREPQLAVMNFKVIDWSTKQVCNWVHHCPPSRADEVFETYEITEGAVAFRAQALRAVGAYWEPFFIGHEGPDLAYRMMDAGWTVVYDGSVVVEHKHEQTARASWRFYYYDTRNQIWVAARRMPPTMAARYLFVGLGAMFVYSVRDGFFRYWVKGIVDGLRGLRRAWSERSVMTPTTRAVVRRIDRERPGFWEQARRRLFQPANRLDA